jgi:hypothetical protein
MANSILLGGNESLIHIPLYYKIKLNKYGVRQFKVLDEDEAKKLLEKPESGVEILNTKWKPQTWQMNNHLLKNSTSYDQASGTHQIDFTKYQDNVFTNCLVEWDMIDEKGQPIPVNPKTVGMLPSSIAQSLIRKYDSSLNIDEEEQGK